MCRLFSPGGQPGCARLPSVSYPFGRAVIARIALTLIVHGVYLASRVGCFKHGME